MRKNNQVSKDSWITNETLTKINESMQNGSKLGEEDHHLSGRQENQQEALQLFCKMKTTWEDHQGHQDRVFLQSPLNQKLGSAIISPMSVALDEPCKIPETSVVYLQNENSLQGAVLPLNVWDIDTMSRESWCFHPWEKMANSHSWP